MHQEKQHAAVRILVVEDEKLVGWSLAKSLNRSGYQTAIVETGEKAIEELKSNSFDLLITDMDLPEVNGLEVAQVAKKIKPSMPVIMISALDIPSSDESSGGSYVDAFVEKPFDLRDVTAIVEFYIPQPL